MKTSALLLCVLLLAGCKKDESKAALAPQPPVTHPNGLVTQILRAGDGDVPKKGDKITVHYVGTLENGTVFDSSREKNRPFSFWIGQKQVIEGWDQGLADMREGELRKLTIPPSLGYGGIAQGDKIPANSTLTFEVELIDVR